MSSEPKHAWSDAKNLNDYWETRECALCGLSDRRLLEGVKYVEGKAVYFPTPDSPWEVTTPCIEPVPDKLAYDDLMADLREHSVSCAEFKPRALGQPGEWRVGLYYDEATGAKGISHAFSVPELEMGWSLILRWFRARLYRPADYKHYRSIGEDCVIFSHDRRTRLH